MNENECVAAVLCTLFAVVAICYLTDRYLCFLERERGLRVQAVEEEKKVEVEETDEPEPEEE